MPEYILSQTQNETTEAIITLGSIRIFLLSRWENGSLSIVSVRFILTMKSHFSINMLI